MNKSVEPAKPFLNPTLSKSLGADYEALQNDLVQAHEFAAELQNELAGKRNDVAHLKQLFEKTQSDLTHMQEGILALRKERHDLANSAMIGMGAEQKLRLVTEERDRLLVAAAESQRREEEASSLLNKRDGQIAELTMQLMILKEELSQAQRRAEAPRMVRAPKSAAAGAAAERAAI